MPASSVDLALDFLVDAILELKTRYKDPFFSLAGDFNDYGVADRLKDYPDLELLLTGPTRGNRTLDLIFTNFSENISESGVIDPLENDLDGGTPSDHGVVFCSVNLPRFQAYEWITFSYMKQTEKGNDLFKNWILDQDWSSFFEAEGSNNKAEAYQALINSSLSSCFPIVSVRRKSTEDPWITDKIHRKIRQRKPIFRRLGRCKAWKKMKKVTNQMIKYRRDLYLEKHKLIITDPDSSRHFFRNVRTYNMVERPKIWDIKTICPELTDEQMAEQLSHFFTKISVEFKPLLSSEIPSTYPRSLPRLLPFQVAGKIKSVKKPRTKI